MSRRYFVIKFLRLVLLLIIFFLSQSFNNSHADNYALIVGVDGDTSRNAKANSELFYDFLHNTGNWQIKKLIEEEATQEKFLSELTKLKDTWKDDVVIIHITAHGFLSKDGKYHFFQLFDSSIPTISLIEKYIT